MKYVSIDLETTGLDPTWCQIIEIAAVIGDTDDTTTPINDLPCFQCYVNAPRIVGEPRALEMNQRILRYLADNQSAMYISEVMEQFSDWGYQNLGSNMFTPAGKAYGQFDHQFLLPHYLKRFRPDHRNLDVGNFYLQHTDIRIPGLEKCVHRAGDAVDADSLHTALYDARLVASLVNKHFMKLRMETAPSPV